VRGESHIPTLSNLGCNLLNLLDSAISSVSISPIISKGVLNVGLFTKLKIYLIYTTGESPKFIVTH
jgi:hypothetical protein